LNKKATWPPDTVKRLAIWLSSHDSPYVFGKPFIDKLYRQLDKVTVNTKFIGLRPHQLRHSFRTNMWLEGVNEQIIDQMVGHTTKAMANRYRHIRNEHIRQGISKVWNRHQQKNKNPGEAENISQ
jgi:integrase